MVLVFDALIASKFFGTKFSKNHGGGLAVIMAAVVVCAALAPRNEYEVTARSMIEWTSAVTGFSFLSCIFFIGARGYFMVRAFERKFPEFPKKRDDVPAATIVVMRIVYPTILAIFETLGASSLKGVTGMIITMSTEEDQVMHPAFWATVLMWVGCIGSTIFWLGKVYAKYPTAECLPIEIGLVTSFSICSGMLFFQEAKTLKDVITMGACSLAIPVGILWMNIPDKVCRSGKQIDVAPKAGKMDSALGGFEDGELLQRGSAEVGDEDSVGSRQRSNTVDVEHSAAHKELKEVEAEEMVVGRRKRANTVDFLDGEGAFIERYKATLVAADMVAADSADISAERNLDTNDVSLGGGPTLQTVSEQGSHGGPRKASLSVDGIGGPLVGAAEGGTGGSAEGGTGGSAEAAAAVAAAAVAAATAERLGARTGGAPMKVQLNDTQESKARKYRYMPQKSALPRERTDAVYATYRGAGFSLTMPKAKRALHEAYEKARKHAKMARERQRLKLIGGWKKGRNSVVAVVAISQQSLRHSHRIVKNAAGKAAGHLVNATNFLEPGHGPKIIETMKVSPRMRRDLRHYAEQTSDADRSPSPVVYVDEGGETVKRQEDEDKYEDEDEEDVGGDVRRNMGFGLERPKTLERAIDGALHDAGFGDDGIDGALHDAGFGDDGKEACDTGGEGSRNVGGAGGDSPSARVGQEARRLSRKYSMSVQPVMRLPAPPRLDLTRADFNGTVTSMTAPAAADRANAAAQKQPSGRTARSLLLPLSSTVESQAAASAGVTSTAGAGSSSASISNASSLAAAAVTPAGTDCGPAPKARQGTIVQMEKVEDAKMPTCQGHKRSSAEKGKSAAKVHVSDDF
jgi:hypothetical protein